MSLATEKSSLSAYRANLVDKKPLSSQQELDLVAAWRAGDTRGAIESLEAASGAWVTIIDVVPLGTANPVANW